MVQRSKMTEEIEEDEFDISKVETKSLEDMFDLSGERFKREHPILNWIDGLFKGKSLANYRASYTITHPWVILKDWGYEIKYAWQRVFKGYDERVVWSIDYYLDKMLPIWLEQLIKDKQGVPMMMFHDEDMITEGKYRGGIKDDAMELRSKEYDAILQKIADGFRMHRKIDDLEFKYDSPEEKEAQAQFDEAFELFHQFYSTLRD